MRREFLQLADHYNPKRHDVAGWFISEKLDGTRCFWDGGASRGLPTASVPWASVTDPKTSNRKGKIKPVATGLWSRYGNPIMAPDWFLNQLPCCPLDGELWAGRGQFQLCRSICAGDTPDPRFDRIVYAVYSIPPLESVFGNGEIKNSNMHCQVDYSRCAAFVKLSTVDDYVKPPAGITFEAELKTLNTMLENTPLSCCSLHKQVRLSQSPDFAAQQVEAFLQSVLDVGGEGIVLRCPTATWVPKRHKGILKYKPFSDDEGVITGLTSGRETDKGSKYLGKIGALILDYHGKRLELSGLTDAEREFADSEMTRVASQLPGTDMPSFFEGEHFKVGQSVTFKYRELSDDGIPKEARYWRVREVE